MNDQIKKTQTPSVTRGTTLDVILMSGLSTLFALLLSSCGGSSSDSSNDLDSSSDSGSDRESSSDNGGDTSDSSDNDSSDISLPSTLAGTSILANALVYRDRSDDGIASANELVGVTDSQGGYSIPAGNAPILIVGIEGSTYSPSGLPANSWVLRAEATATEVNVITTLQKAGVNETVINQLYTAPTTTSITTPNVDLQVVNTVAKVAQFVQQQKDNNTTSSDTINTAWASMAIAMNESSEVNLSNQELLQNILAESFKASNGASSQESVQTKAKTIAELNKKIANKDLTSLSKDELIDLAKLVNVIVLDDLNLQQTKGHFSVEGEHSVFNKGFNVLEPGTVTLTVEWNGNEALNLILVNASSYSSDGISPLKKTAEDDGKMTLHYEVTSDDLQDSTNFRFAIKSVNNNEVSGTYTLLTPFNAEKNADFELNKISLNSGDFFPREGNQNHLLQKIQKAVDNNPINAKFDGVHGILNLNTTPTCNDLMFLNQEGLFREDFLPGYNSLGLIDKDVELNSGVAKEYGAKIVLLQPADKVDPDLLLGNFEPYIALDEANNNINYVANNDGTINVNINLWDGADFKSVLNLLRDKLSLTQQDYSVISPTYFQATINPDDVITLAESPWVKTVTAFGAPQISENANTAPMLEFNAINASPTAPEIIPGQSSLGLTGAGITAAVKDNGVWNHANLNLVRDDILMSWVSSAPDHGTHVAGIIDFLAPGVTIYDDPSLVANANMITATTPPNSIDVINQSQALGNAVYTSDAQLIDEQIQGFYDEIPPLLRIFSAGNSGEPPSIQLYSLTKQVKNALLVGNYNTNDDDGNWTNDFLRWDSSMGPFQDGRLGPDIVAPGTGINSLSWTHTVDQNGDGIIQTFNEITTVLDSNGDGLFTVADLNAYIGDAVNNMGGTSMAAPVATATTALMLEAWENTYLSPLGSDLDAIRPYPSTLRAILINTADDIDTVSTPNVNFTNNTTGNVKGLQTHSEVAALFGNGIVMAGPGPDYATGWGMINPYDAVNMVLQDREELGGIMIPKHIVQDSISHLQVLDYDFVIDQDWLDNNPQLQIALAWDDIASTTGLPNNTIRLVNDLDLELIDPNGVVYYPWQLGHQIRDAAGNIIPTANQTPGTPIFVDRPDVDEADIANTFDDISITRTASFAGTDSIPQAAFQAGGIWFATPGRDHLNNAEQVTVATAALPTGHWTARVSGFDVNVDQGEQLFSLAGIPYPDLADLVVTTEDKVMLTAGEIDLEFTVENIGQKPADATQFGVYISKDATVDTSDLNLTPTINNLSVLDPGASETINTTVSISDAVVAAWDPAIATVANLVENDYFMLVKADVPDTVLEHQEENTAVMQVSSPVSVVLVLDRSGSMNDQVPLSNNQTKLSLMQSASNLFTDMMRVNESDKLAIIEFDASAEATHPLSILTSGSLTVAQNTIDTITANGMTNIDAALTAAIDLIKDEDDNKAIVFLSDGKQTTDTLTDTEKNTIINSATTNDIAIYSVGLGDANANELDLDLLQDLANGTEGSFFQVASSALQIDKFFVNALAGAINDEVIFDPTGILHHGQSKSISVTLGSNDSTIKFIQTDDHPNAELNLSLLAPNGEIIRIAGDEANDHLYAPHVSVVTSNSYNVIEVNLLGLQQTIPTVGKWEMLLSNDSGVNGVGYSASAIGQGRLHVAANDIAKETGANFQGGDQVPLSVTVTSNGIPITQASVLATVTAPSSSVASLMKEYLPGMSIAGAAKNILGDEQPLYDLEFYAAQYLASKMNQKVGETVSQFYLTDSGNGTYSGSFDRTDFEGAYEVVYTIHGTVYDEEAFDCEGFSRELTQSFYVDSDRDHQQNPPDLPSFTFDLGTLNNIAGTEFTLNDIQAQPIEVINAASALSLQTTDSGSTENIIAVAESLVSGTQPISVNPSNISNILVTTADGTLSFFDRSLNDEIDDCFC